MNDKNDQALDEAVKRLAEGDPDAREQLINLSFERIKKLSKHMLKQFPMVRRWEETDDVFQQAAFRLWRALEDVKPEQSRHFFNLAAVQIRRELIEIARKLDGVEGNNRNLESVGGEDARLESPAPLGSSSDTYESGSLAIWTEFHQSIEQLDAEEKEVFELIWYQGLSQEKVSQLIDVPQRTVSRRWQRARRKVYEILGRQLPG